MSKGWISLHRRIRDHWLWNEKPFDKRSAWIDLLMEVNHKDNKFLLGNELIECPRGSTITSIRQLCDRWQWSNTKVTTFLKLLKEDGMIDFKSDKKKTVIIIVNYDSYQNTKDTETTQERHESDTETSQKHTNNNDNNENNLLLYPSKEFPNFYKWIEDNNYTKESEYPNDKPYYLKYLHEKANFYSKTRGKNHPDTISAVKAFENKKAVETEEVILKAQSIS